ncbi:MAG: Zn-binding domain-containing protein [Caulobacterales bacterium]
MRKALAVETEALNSAELESRAERSRAFLRSPWAISQEERIRTAGILAIEVPPRAQLQAKDDALLLRAGPRSALARNVRKLIGSDIKLDGPDYIELINAILGAAEEYALVRQVETDLAPMGWRLVGARIRLLDGPGDPEKNAFFQGLYRTIAVQLAHDDAGVFGLESREHTAQVDQDRREWREKRFRWESKDREFLSQRKEELKQAGEPGVFLPALFCSPTMELGVDISALNAVFLRNAPPTPANYAQRSGRAGRSGQAALVVTYCAAQSPHDQYYFERRLDLVAGVVKPPALDLANEDLIRAHLHAVWLGSSSYELAGDIPKVLDLTIDRQPLLGEVAAALGADDVLKKSLTAMRRVLKLAEADVAGGGEWAEDLDGYAESVARDSAEQFDAAFNRWRTLYQSAQSQLREANRITETPGIPARERKEAKSQQIQANEQIALLESGRSQFGSDFYTYRYLATEGFLPGYNFPRLPLYAFVPGATGGSSRPAFLQRARFLAIAEFGPQSLIYHEGRAFRVVKAKLPPGLRDSDGRLTTDKLWLCQACGAAHKDEVERCAVCSDPMAGAMQVRDVLRIDNVETRPVERITANDEDRQRQGFEIQSTFAWPERKGGPAVWRASSEDDEGIVLRADYSAGTTISRLNFGLRRRRDPAKLGFGINPSTGRWETAPGEPQEEQQDPDKTPPQRVVPIVQDVKNAALIQIADAERLERKVTATVQHALSRGIEITFELEEGEVLTEPMPRRDERRAILAYEATEGGAGVLSRLVRDQSAFAEVARAALETMHFTCESIDAAVSSGSPDDLKEQENVACVSGCYRCLLSYYNQPEHDLIERRNPDAITILLRLARSQTKTQQPTAHGNAWASLLEAWNLPAADASPVTIAGRSFALAWRSALVIADATPPTAVEQTELDAKGFEFVQLPTTPNESARDALRAALGVQ